MFYFLINPFLTYNTILVVAAVVPAIYLLYKVYQLDHVEKESPSLLWSLVTAGVLSTTIALVSEWIFSYILDLFLSPDSLAYRLILYYLVVGVSEEGAKHFVLKKKTWNSPEFNCMYDGIVYATFVSLGFALWENISYVMHYGFANALVRAFTAIPGHASFGIFMGVFYAAAKMYDNYGVKDKADEYMLLSIVVPVLIHGSYDFIATMPTTQFNYFFIVFVILLFVIANKVIKSASRNDNFI